jgi:hypothetical protein
MSIPRYIRRLLLLLMLAVSAMSSAMAQTTYQGKIDTLDVVAIPGDTYLWELYTDPPPDFATTPGDVTTQAIFIGGNTGPMVMVQWIVPGVYFYKVTAWSPNGCMNLKVGKIEVLPSMPTLTISPDTICAGETANLSVSFFNGTGPWNITIEDDDPTTPDMIFNNISTNPFIIPVSPTITTNYRVASVTYIPINFTFSDPTPWVQLLVHPLPVTSPIYKY